jgi:hypothetical protein
MPGDAPKAAGHNGWQQITPPSREMGAGLKILCAFGLRWAWAQGGRAPDRLVPPAVPLLHSMGRGPPGVDPRLIDPHQPRGYPLDPFRILLGSS